MSRLIMVSNRVPLPSASGGRAGGLGTAISAALRSQGGLWFGWSGAITDDAEISSPTIHNFKRQTLVTIDLSPEEYEKYYCGFSNRFLWPSFHYRADLAHYSDEEFRVYMQVNKRFANKLSKIIKHDDIIWIHDYHLLPLGRELRRIGIENPIGYFLHIPFPAEEITKNMPPLLDIGQSLICYDVIGLQTKNDADNIRDFLTQFKNHRAYHNGFISKLDYKPVIRHFPISIPTSVIARMARRAHRTDFAHSVTKELGGASLIIGVDRLDYSKGIPQRLLAFQSFLDTNPNWQRKIKYTQITPKTRVDIEEYGSIGMEVDRLIGSINGKYSDISWNPIFYTNKYFSPTKLSVLYRTAHIGLVTPLRDGMNLVAKEYVAAQDAADPGVLILSKFAGAAFELSDALVVDPYDHHAVAEMIRVALEMPLSERRERHSRMMDILEINNLEAWYTSFLDELISERNQRVNRHANIARLGWYERIGFRGV